MSPMLSLHGPAWAGASCSLSGRPALGFSLLALAFSMAELMLTLQASSRAGLLAVCHALMGPLLPSQAISRFSLPMSACSMLRGELSLLAPDFSTAEAILLARSSSCPEFLSPVCGIYAARSMSSLSVCDSSSLEAGPLIQSFAQLEAPLLVLLLAQVAFPLSLRVVQRMGLVFLAVEPLKSEASILVLGRSVPESSLSPQGVLCLGFGTSSCEMAKPGILPSARRWTRADSALFASCVRSGSPSSTVGAACLGTSPSLHALRLDAPMSLFGMPGVNSSLVLRGFSCLGASLAITSSAGSFMLVLEFLHAGLPALCRGASCLEVAPFPVNFVQAEAPSLLRCVTCIGLVTLLRGIVPVGAMLAAFDTSCADPSVPSRRCQQLEMSPASSSTTCSDAPLLSRSLRQIGPALPQTSSWVGFPTSISESAVVGASTLLRSLARLDFVLSASATCQVEPLLFLRSCSRSGSATLPWKKCRLGLPFAASCNGLLASFLLAQTASQLELALFVTCLLSLGPPLALQGFVRLGLPLLLPQSGFRIDPGLPIMDSALESASSPQSFALLEAASLACPLSRLSSPFALPLSDAIELGLSLSPRSFGTPGFSLTIVPASFGSSVPLRNIACPDALLPLCGFCGFALCPLSGETALGLMLSFRGTSCTGFATSASGMPNPDIPPLMHTFAWPGLPVRVASLSDFALPAGDCAAFGAALPSHGAAWLGALLFCLALARSDVVLLLRCVSCTDVATTIFRTSQIDIPLPILGSANMEPLSLTKGLTCPEVSLSAAGMLGSLLFLRRTVRLSLSALLLSHASFSSSPSAFDAASMVTFASMRSLAQLGLPSAALNPASLGPTLILQSFACPDLATAIPGRQAGNVLSLCSACVESTALPRSHSQLDIMPFACVASVGLPLPSRTAARAGMSLLALAMAAGSTPLALRFSGVSSPLPTRAFTYCGAILPICDLPLLDFCSPLQSSTCLCMPPPLIGPSCVGSNSSALSAGHLASMLFSHSFV
ncbi:unnamed protein product [Effrenium voratum]|uniref:Uncharacterized protein n=1 Tax=Effrenium voratum TaxID=2562239 RepID=A0AA36IKW6_9DINO|nr:unnamed protein product [Effrenium voratum]